MEYINKNTGEKISEFVYLQLSELGKSNFIRIGGGENITINNSETTDLLGIGKAVETVVVSPLAVDVHLLNKLF